MNILKCRWRVEIGYNKHAGTNARQIVPVTGYTEVSTGSELDILLYLNNYDLIELGKSCMDVDMQVDEALDTLEKVQELQREILKHIVEKLKLVIGLIHFLF